MSKFDEIFESVMWSLKEKEQTSSDDLEFNIKTMVLKLQDPINGYLSDDHTTEEYVKQVLANQNVLDIGADEKTFLPKIRIQFGQSPDVEDFEVEVQVLAKSNANKETYKKFQNSSPETICDDVIAFIDQVKMEAATGDAAVKNLPEQPNDIQPGGGGGTALPTGSNGAPPEQEPQPAV